MLDFDWMPGAVIFRHRRAIAWGALVLVVVAAVFALPVFGELGNENDFDDPAAEAVAARNAVNRAHRRVRGAEPHRAGAARRAGRERAGAGADRARGGGAARPGRGVGRRRTQPGGDRRLVSTDGRSTYLLATFKNDPAGARTRIEERARATCPG